MYRILRVGDPHVTVSNLEESRKLMNFVIQTAKDQKVNWIEFLGDLFHTHAVVRAEVLNFWKETFDQLGDAEIETRVLVGNHDQIGDKERENVHALLPFKGYPFIRIIDKVFLAGPFVYSAYTASEETFLARIDMARNGPEGTGVVICHQTFVGCQFENGFYAPEGFDLSKIQQKHVISGHIHKQQQIGKCDYPGTAKWDKATDAGQDKGIWIYNHEKDGTITSKEFFTTKDVVTPIFQMVLHEGDPEPELPENARIALELVGQSAWIAKMKKKYKGKASIRGKPADRKTVAVDQSKLLNINEFILANFQPIEGISKEDIVNYIRGFDVAA